MNKKEDSLTFTVSAFLDYINEVFKIREYQIQGEISELTIHPTGVYCTLKDETESAVMNCYISTWKYKSIGKILEIGMKIRCTGTPSVYKPKGRLSFQIENFEYTGEGTLKKAYEILKAKLESEGIFERKRPLPECIGVIGVITSKTGAVINDFRNNLAKRGYKVLLCNTKVEGKDAEAGVSRGIRIFNEKINVDVIVVMRGGGSLEDLEAFNSENVARAVFNSRIPTVCAIGHDKDIPLACLSADSSPSTPTAAAVLVNASWDQVTKKQHELESRIVAAVKDAASSTKERIKEVLKSLTHELRAIRRKHEEIEHRFSRVLTITKDQIKAFSQSVSDKTKRMISILHKQEEYYPGRLKILEDKLALYNPERMLVLGYSITQNLHGKVVKSVHDTKNGEKVVTRLSDGSVVSRVESIHKNG